MTPQSSPQNPLNPKLQSPSQNLAPPAQKPAAKVSWRLKSPPFLVLDAIIVLGIIALCIFAFAKNKELRGKNSDLGNTKTELKKKGEDLATATTALEKANEQIAKLLESVADKDKDIADKDAEIVLQGQDIIKQQEAIVEFQANLEQLLEKEKQLTGDLTVSQATIVRLQGEVKGHKDNIRVAQGKIQDLDELLSRTPTGANHIDEAAKLLLEGQINKLKTDKGEAGKIAAAEKRLEDWKEAAAKHAAEKEARQEKKAALEMLKVKLLAGLEKRNGELKALEEKLGEKANAHKRQLEQELADLEEKLKGEAIKVQEGLKGQISEYQQSFKDSVIALDIIGDTYKRSLNEEINQIKKDILAKYKVKGNLKEKLKGLDEELNSAKKQQALLAELAKATPELKPLQKQLEQIKDEIDGLEKETKPIGTEADGEVKASGKFLVLDAEIKDKNDRLEESENDLKLFEGKQEKARVQATNYENEFKAKLQALEAKLGDSEKDLKDTRTELEKKNELLSSVRKGWENNPGTEKGLDAVFDLLHKLVGKDLMEATRGAEKAQEKLEKTKEDIEKANADLTDSNVVLLGLKKDIGKLLKEQKEEGSDFSESNRKKLGLLTNHYKKTKDQDGLRTEIVKLKTAERVQRELLDTKTMESDGLNEVLARKKEEIEKLKVKINSGDGQIAAKDAEIDKLKKEIATLEKDHKEKIATLVKDHNAAIEKKDEKIIGKNNEIIFHKGRENSELVRFAKEYVDQVREWTEKGFVKKLTDEGLQRDSELLKLENEIVKSRSEIENLESKISNPKIAQDAQKEDDPECDPTTKKDGSSAEKGKSLAEMKKDLAKMEKERDQHKVEKDAITGVLGAVKTAQKND